MKKGYQTISGLKKECLNFKEKVVGLSFENLTEQELKDKILKAEEPEEIAALTAEVIYRIKGLRLFECQISTAAALYFGHIAELPTGEGKTLSAVLAAVLYAKSGRNVHILVFNDYLAKRDAADNEPIFSFCGISSAFITEQTERSKRAENYKAQVVYISAREAGYDSVRDFVASEKCELSGAVYDVAIVDEADSILIDEASIPLVLASRAEQRLSDVKRVIDAVKALDSNDFEINEAERQIWLTDSGISAMESVFLADNLYGNENIDLLSNINTALEAVYILKKDKDYIVKNNKIAIIDEATGRVAANRKFPNALHRFVELKEGITDNISTRIYCTMTISAFLDQYATLCGMTGTAATSESEFESTYNLRTVVFEPHTPCIRIDLPDEVFSTDKQRDDAVIQEIINANKKGQPVLIGTASVMQSEHFSKLLYENGLKHNVLNARNDELEAELIAQAGKPYAITVSTNMAGRGVDIKLGGMDEKEKELVSNAGGLYVISTCINRSRRIDNQLRGRAGRQGDAGMSKFFISLQDENISPFFEEQPDSRKKISEKEKFALVRSAQKTLEGNEAEARYTLKKYSYIIEHQRRLLSDYKMKLLNDEITPDILKENDFDRYLELEKTAGEEGIKKAETALLLGFINLHFADYLEAMEEIKSGIHLTVVAGKNPFDEFNRAAISAFDEMNEDIRFDVLKAMQEGEVTKNGIDTSAFGFKGNTGTWTYMVDDSAGQFNHLPELLNMFGKKIKEKLSFSEKMERFLSKRKK